MSSIILLGDLVVQCIYLCTGRFTFLNEKYEKLVGSEFNCMCMCMFHDTVSFAGSLDLAKQSVADIQLRSRNQSMYHPKLQTMVSVVNTWRTNTRKHSREKVYLYVHVCVRLGSVIASLLVQ